MTGLTMKLSNVLNRLDHLVDWFIPAEIAADKDARKQARLFLISHLLGPFIGSTVPIALYIFDPNPHWDIVVLALSIIGFWIFPPLLKTFGHYNLLALVSIQNLIFCILWSCYFYGGVTSPTLSWVLTIPLLAFFYVGDSARLRLMVLSMFAVNLVGFFSLFFFRPPEPHGMPLAEMQALGLVSTIAAALYVTMMAVYYAKALASQGELEAVMRQQMATAVDLRQAAIDAERAGKAKSEFLAKMSHELRTPLNAVIGYSQMLMEDAADSGDDEDVPDLEKIHAAGHHLLKLVNNVLDLSKIEAGHMELYNDDYAVAAVVSTAVEGLRAFAASNGNDLRLEISPGAGTINGDALKMQHAVANIVENAIKYTRDGIVTVSCVRVPTAVGEAIEVRVRDTGIGIDANDLPSLFEQFAVVDDQTSTKYGGTGVGLALTRKLCRLMGGDVAVESRPGVGSCFTLTVPVGGKAAPVADPLGPPRPDNDLRLTQGDLRRPVAKTTFGQRGRERVAARA
ncbi:sensor histidine kinase [Ensifer soli]|uniref:sensor histidine kinase n=1 Tax=Ciceribacter sp. sgz301302 TaxID=3342379 RepID=UPI0035BA9CB2